MNSLGNKKIGIAGGGPGGLTLARLLQMKGANVTVYERDYDRFVRQQGATLDLHQESGLKALQEAGLMDAFKKNFRPGADKTRVVDQHATIFFDDHASQETAAFESVYFRPEIDRGPLRELLLDSLADGTVVWDRQFQSMMRQEDGWEIMFANGTTATADLVIGADGAHSKLRPYLTLVKPFYTGVTAVEGTVYDAQNRVPNIYKLLQDGKIFAFGDEQVLIVGSKGDGSLAFYTSCKMDKDWASNSGIDFTDNAQVLGWFKKEFSSWNDCWYELFGNANSFYPRPIYSMPTNQSWEPLPDLTLLGDAAHLMPPYAGEGVNMAMLDALHLSASLLNESHPGLKERISAYEQKMFATASEAAEASLVNTEWMHSEKALSMMLQMFGNV